MYVCGLVKYSTGESVENSGPNTSKVRITTNKAPEKASKYVPKKNFCLQDGALAACNQKITKRKNVYYRLDSSGHQ